jgi:hypothetical protein
MLDILGRPCLSTDVSFMLCEMCHQREATVHLAQTFFKAVPAHEPGTQKQHLCQECADTYFACTQGMNSLRGLICLSDAYRTRLYDLLEKTHPEAFDNHDKEACRRGSKLTREFLREQLKKENIEVNDDAFDMLCQSFWSREFYDRADDRRKKGEGNR